MRQAEETARLHLVALACEVAVVAALIDQELVLVAGQAEAEEIGGICSTHRSAADRVLSAETPSEAPSLQDLRSALEKFRTRVADVRDLRERLAGMHATKVSRRLRFPRTSQRAARFP